MSRPAGSVASGSERLAQLYDERGFLLSSIEDLEREQAAGDVAASDYEELRRSYVARAAAALREIALLEQQAAAVAAPAEGGHPGAGPAEARPDRGGPDALRRFLGRRGTRRWLGVVGTLCVLGIVAIVAAHFAGVRLPGETSNGSAVLPTAAAVRQDLSEAAVLGSEGDLTQALDLYDEVLVTVPRQPEALAYRGWLLRLSGVAGHSAATVAEGDAQLAEAVRVAPRYANARALYGVALLEDEGRLDSAITEFRAYLADGPQQSLLELVGAQMASAFVKAHEPVPAVLVPYRSAGRSASA